MQLLVKGRGDIMGYYRQDAIELGLVGAVVWQDIVCTAELLNTNPFWYDQKQAAERLGIEYNRLNRSIKTLVKAGRISTKNGFRPNSITRTTWITIPEEWIERDFEA